jgi:hypothetical protein
MGAWDLLSYSKAFEMTLAERAANEKKFYKMFGVDMSEAK